MKMLALSLTLGLISQNAFAFIFSCQVENKMEMVNIIKKYDYTNEPGTLPGQGLYILELHTIGEPFSHTAVEGLGTVQGEVIHFKTDIIPLEATLHRTKNSGILMQDQQLVPFKDCVQIQ